MSRFGIQQFRLNGASTYVAGARSYGVERGRNVDPQGTDGTVFETAHHVTQVRPGSQLTSRSLKAMAQLLVSSSDVPLLSLDAVNGISFYLAKGATNLPAYAGGSTTLERKALRGCLYMSELSWAKGQKAEMGLSGMFFSPDGSTASITPATVSQPTAALPDFGFTLASIQVAGQTISLIDSLRLSCDPRMEWDYTAGLPEPTSLMGAGPNGQAVIGLTAEVGDCDLGEGTGACVATFNQYAHGGGFGSAQLIATLNSAWSLEESLGGENGQPGKRQLRVRTIYDGANKPLVLSWV